MERQRLIRPNIEAMAHGIRGYGNEMAHGDFVVPVSAQESALVIQLRGEILDEVYQSPARLRQFSKRSPTVSKAAHSSDPPAGSPRNADSSQRPAEAFPQVKCGSAKGAQISKQRQTPRTEFGLNYVSLGEVGSLRSACATARRDGGEDQGNAGVLRTITP